MQEVLKKTSSVTEEVEARTVTIFVQSKSFTLKGLWQWDLLSDAVYCSDVMLNLPENFIGTKGIIHPDDIAEIHKSIYFREAIGEEDTSNIKFRIITTYGEVRTLTGKKITFVKREEDRLLDDPIEAMLRKVADEIDFSKEARLLSLRKELAEFSEKINQTGTWYFNLSSAEAYYSDSYYRLFSLPPQSLNAQLYTFAGFLHPDDKNAVIEAIDKSCAERLPINIQYRIIRADDRVRYLQHTAKVSFNAEGENVVYGVVKDITEQKLQEIDLEQASLKLDLQNKILDFTDNTTGVGHWFVDLMTRKFSFSEQYYKIVGLRGPNIIPSLTTITQFVHPDDQHNFTETHRNIILQHAAPDAEFRIIRADGKTRYIHIKGKLITSGSTDMIVIGTIKDITSEKVTEKKLAELKNEIFLKDLTYSRAEQMAGMAGWVWEVSINKITWSNNLFSLLGVKNTEDFTIKSVMKFIHPQDRKVFSDHIEAASQDGASNELEFRLLARGETKHFKAIFKAVSEENSRFVICIIQDVTSQYALQQRLTDRLYFTELLSDSIEEKVIIIDINYSIIEWNRASENSFGKKKGDVLFHNFFDVFPDLKNSDLVENFTRVIAGETVSTNTSFNAYLKGFHAATLSPLRDANDNVIGIMQVFADMTKEVELQHRLNQRLNFIENLVEVSVNPLIVLDKHLNYMYWNRSAEQAFGINKEVVIGKNIVELVPPVYTPSHVQFRQVLKGETIYIPVKENENGEYYEVYLVPIKDDRNLVTGVLWLLYNLTKEMLLAQQHQALAQTLQREHRRLKEAQEIGHIGSFEWDAKSDAVTWSDEMYRIHGLEPGSEEITLERVLSFVHKDDLQQTIEKIQQCRNEQSHTIIKHRIIRVDGQQRNVKRQLQSFVDENGKVTHITGTIQDITEQMQAEETVEQMLNGSVAAITILESLRNEEGNIIDFVFKGANKASEEINRVPLEELVGKRLLEVFPGVKDVFFDTYVKVVETGEPSRVTSYYGHEHFDNWFDVSAVKSGDGLIMTYNDITPQKKVEQQLQESGEMLNAIMQAQAVSLCAYKAIRDNSGKIIDLECTFANDVTKRITYNVNLVGTRYLEVFPNTAEMGVLEAFRKVIETGKKLDQEFEYSDQGKTRWFHCIAVKLGDGIVLNTEDVTHRKRAEAELKKNIAILEHSEGLAKTGSWEYDLETGNFSWSEGMYDLFSAERGSRVIPETYLDYVVKEDRPVAKRIVLNVKKGLKPFEETVRIQSNDHIKTLKVKGIVVNNSRGDAEKMIGVDMDITETLQAEAKVRESEYLLRQTTAATPDAIIIFDLLKKEPLYLNNCLSSWLTYTNEELLQMGFEGRLQLIQQEERPKLMEHNNSMLKATDEEVKSIEYSLETKDGNLIRICNRTKVFKRDDKGKVIQLLSVLQKLPGEGQK